MLAVLQRRGLATPAICLLALLGGAVAGREPKLALGAVAAVGVAMLVLRSPAVAAAVLVFLTAVVPYGIQNRLGIGGGAGSPGLLLSDIMLLMALAWAFLALADQRLSHREYRFLVGILAFIVLLLVQFVHGVRAGHDISRVGQEFRVLLGFGTFLVVLPLLSDPRLRRQLFVGLAVTGFLLGLWGMLQWFGHFSLGAAGDVGVRTGVRLTSGGSGQLQGGEYGFPVVITMCFAVLLSGAVRSKPLRWLLIGAIALNAASCLLTFERTFWLDALLGIAVVVVRAPGRQRIRVFLAAPFVLLVAFVALSAFAPKQLSTAGQRLLSLGQYTTDDSVRYRLVESRFVLQQVHAHPVTGSGLAGTIFWGQPWAQVSAKAYTFSHDGYLWLAWKLGIPAAALLVLLIGWAIIVRGPPDRDPIDAAVRRGAQASLAGVLLASATFPSFSALSITTVMGVLLALAVARRPQQA
jgi:hypothetical protein